ncbi:MAG: helix-turn-helix domain-containing protein [Nocardioides sp.]|uniref:TetR/AcrR family transcriptional regulator n=1 Tax=Nocardioides sp. TaxID=35761 RepID=UPI0039E3B197
MTETADRPPGLRADAERNRQRILDAACDLFRESGLEVPLEEVARRAGVGIATLYRRFPNRSDLAAAAFAEQLSHYAEVVDAAAAQPDPWQSIVALVHDLSDLQARDAGLRELLTMSFAETPGVQKALSLVQSRLEALIARVRDSGSLRPDFDPADLMLFMLGNSGIVRRLDGRSDTARHRSAALFLEAIRNRPDPEPLPPAPDVAELKGAMRQCSAEG